jgi:hypothetical protein
MSYPYNVCLAIFEMWRATGNPILPKPITHIFRLRHSSLNFHHTAIQKIAYKKACHGGNIAVNITYPVGYICYKVTLTKKTALTQLFTYNITKSPTA